MLDHAIQVTDGELALLCVLLLRGAQTPGELKGRTERLHRFNSLEEVEGHLDALAARDLVTVLPRRPGQKEERYAQLLGGESPPPVSERPVVESVLDASEAADRVTALEQEVRALRDEVTALRSRLDALER
jgi:uncharacterized protein